MYKLCLVSIILPVYNWKKKWLSEAIDSVMNQSYKEFELIIINDCSTNDIEKTIIKYQKEDKRIIYIKNKKRSWWNYTKNIIKWIKKSKWKYIARIDQDDIWSSSNKLKNQVDFMENNKMCGVCGTGVILIDLEWHELNKLKVRETDKEIRNNILKDSQFAHPSVLINKYFLDLAWWYNSNRTLAEDYELWLRMWIISEFHNLPDYAFKYRTNPHSTSNKNRFKQKILSLKLTLKYWKYYPNFIYFVLLKVFYTFFPDRIWNIFIKRFKR